MSRHTAAPVWRSRGHRRAVATAAALVGALALAACQTPVAPGSAPSSTTGADRTPIPPAPSATAGSGPGASHPAGPSSGPPSGPASPSSAPAELPRGGRTVFPHYRLVGYAGAPGAPSLGRLGIGDLDQRVDEIEQRAQPFADGREVMPVLELIATVVQGSPGPDGLYRRRLGDDVIKRYLAAARRHDAMLLLNIQPGRAHFIDEVKHYRRWLEQPDVGLALDPEWAVGPHSVPMQVFGHTTGEELDQVSRYVAGIVRAQDLPQKVIVYHQLNSRIVRDPDGLKPHPGVAMVQSVDGIGVPVDKEKTWRRVVKDKPAFVHPGFKLFYEEDAEAGALMTPAQVMALRPTPEYVLYE